jgi:hypothetical protein
MAMYRPTAHPMAHPGAEQPDLVPVYAGPTPADPFGGGHVFDIFDVMEQAELNAAPPNRPHPGRRGSGRPLALAAATLGRRLAPANAGGRGWDGRSSGAWTDRRKLGFAVQALHAAS